MKLLERLFERLRKYDDAHSFTCDLCGAEVFFGERVCERCLRELPFNDGKICPLCGRKVGEAGVCLECKRKPLGVTRARSVFTYDGEAVRLVSRFKRGKKYLYRTAADFMTPIAEREFPEADSVTFVPMTERAEKRRGYNQSRLLAEELSRRTALAFLDCAVKTRETAPQKSLGRREREENLTGTFHVFDRKSVRGRKILILDDIMTTGATASVLSDALKRAGADELFLLTVTSVPQKPFV